MTSAKQATDEAFNTTGDDLLPESSLVLSDDSEDYSLSSRFNPEVYTCSGYEDEVWEFFDGSPGQDARFTIDLEGGSMDRLRDVRPYLYYVGYWSVPPSQSQPEVEKLGPAAVEDAYVRMGRMYLIEQRERRVGYFLAKRDWAVHNVGRFIRWPCQALVHSDPKDGDVGFSISHDDEDYEEDCIGHVVKTNIRSPLPKEALLTTKPGNGNWDRFIQWIYQPEIHGALLLMKGWPARNIRYNRAVRGLGTAGWLKKEAVNEW